MRVLRKPKFRAQVLGIMLVVLLLIAVTGFYAYRQFSSIVSSITRDAKPDLYLITAKSLANDIQNAENFVKTYRLTEDTSYIFKFYSSVQWAEDRMQKLKDLESENPHFGEIDSFVFLVEAKFLVLDELLHASKLFRVQKALDKAVSNIRKNVQTIDSETSSEPQGNAGIQFLKKLFQTKTEVATEPTNPGSSEEVAMVDVNKQLAALKYEEHRIEQKIKEEELRLIEKDLELSRKLKSQLSSLEQRELELLDARKEAAALSMIRTNRQIALVCVAIGLLLLFMAYMITNYIRHNNQYRKVMRKARREAENLAAAKERFLANVSHEIRTPLHAIAGFTEQLAGSRLDNSQKDQIDIIQSSIEHLLFLVNDVLDYSKLKAGKLKLEKLAFKPDVVARECMRLVSPIAEQKELKLDYIGLDLADFVLRGDMHRFKQVLINLLTNAIKFTDKGGVKLQISFSRDEAKGQVQINISDTGKGMSREQVSRIFEAFEQADASISRTYGGTGLGLSIVRELIELQQGTISFESEENQGTEVKMSIPFEVGSEEDLNREAVESKNSGLPDLEGLRCLVVDDELFNRKLICSILEGRKMKISQATTGLEALTRVIDESFDLILMDTHMPELNGIDACIQIREFQDSEKSSIPIIALTAAVSDANQQMYSKVGMNGFLAKPFTETQLLKCISEALGYGKVEINDMSLEGSAEIEAAIDFGQLRSLSGDNMEFYADMLQTFKKSCESGLIKLREHFEKEDWYLVSEYAHKMCSPCRHLRAYALHRTLKELEESARDHPDTGSIEILIEKAGVQYSEISKILDEELLAAEN